MGKTIYLDNASTTPVHTDVIKEVIECLTDDFGNPSSLHRLGFNAEKRMRQAREQIANLLMVSPDELVFTSGGTEGNNLAIFGSLAGRRAKSGHCITTVIEHPSVLNSFIYLEGQGWDVSYIPVDKRGVINIDDVANALRPDTQLVSIMHVNNEIGSIQPVEQIGKMLKSMPSKPVFHVDATQSFGKLQIMPGDWGIDLLSFSGHKIHAPKGIGGLYTRKGIRLNPLQWGGGQENGIRSGTENIPGIAGLGKAVELISGYMKEDPERIYNMKMYLANEIKKIIPDAVINGPYPDEGAPHILNVSFPGIRGEVLLHALEAKGIFVSTGSACSSKKRTISHVLHAISTSKAVAEGAIRLSLSYINTFEQIENVPFIIKQTVEELKPFMRR